MLQRRFSSASTLGGACLIGLLTASALGGACLIDGCQRNKGCLLSAISDTLSPIEKRLPLERLWHNAPAVCLLRGITPLRINKFVLHLLSSDELTFEIMCVKYIFHSVARQVTYNAVDGVTSRGMAQVTKRVHRSYTLSSSSPPPAVERFAAGMTCPLCASLEPTPPCGVP